MKYHPQLFCVWRLFMHVNGRTVLIPFLHHWQHFTPITHLGLDGAAVSPSTATATTPLAASPLMPRCGGVLQPFEEMIKSSRSLLGFALHLHLEVLRGLKLQAVGWSTWELGLERRAVVHKVLGMREGWWGEIVGVLIAGHRRRVMRRVVGLLAPRIGVGRRHRGVNLRLRLLVMGALTLHVFKLLLL